MQTPWGRSQETTRISQDITRLSTASHGGYHCTGQAQRTIETAVPDFKPWAGRGWYEEDVDWAVVAVMHDAWFDAAAIDQAVRTLSRRREGDYLTPVREWLAGDSQNATIVRLRAQAYAEAHAHHYEVSGCGSAPTGYPDGAWQVSLRQRTTGERRTIILADYPHQGIYSAAEIAAQDITHT